MFDVIKLIKSRITFVIESVCMEKILNMMEEAEKIIWLDADRVLVTASLSEYRHIRDICRKNGCKTKIKSKKGLAFRTSFLRRRYGLFIGAGVFLFTLYMLMSRIWTLTVTSDNADEQMIYEIARQYGIEAGAEKAGLDIPHINRQIMKDHPELQYFNVNFYGSHGEIVVKMRDNIKEVIDEDVYCDIVADRDGVVESIVVRNGKAKVTEGQTVIEGDLLIKGEISYMAGEETVYQPVHASGDVILRTWNRRHEVIPKYFGMKEKTGRETRRYTFIAGNKGFPLYFLEKNPYMCYDKRYKVSYFTLFGENRLPIGLSCETYNEVVLKTAMCEADEGEVFKEMREDMLSENGVVEIKADSLDITDKGEYYLAKYEAECLEKAGVESLK